MMLLVSGELFCCLLVVGCFFIFANGLFRSYAVSCAFIWLHFTLVFANTESKRVTCAG